MFFRIAVLSTIVFGVAAAAQAAAGVTPPFRKTERWITADDGAPGPRTRAEKEAVQAALRKCVERACGVFLRAQTETRDYQAIYDKVLADTPGYVIEYDVLKVWEEDGITWARVKALVSTKQFRLAWNRIAHIVERENNPRVIIGVAETTVSMVNTLTEEIDVIVPAGRKRSTSKVWEKATEEIHRGGTVQTKLEEYFTKRDIVLVDRTQADTVDKRDLILAATGGDPDKIAALKARFDADVVLIGAAAAEYGGEVGIAGRTMHRYTAKMAIRAVRTDTARLLAAKTIGPIAVNSMQKAGGEDEALAALANKAAPEVLTAIVEAWRKQVHVAREIRLLIDNMSFAAWKALRAEAMQLKGVQAMRLREITKSVATIDVEYDFDTQNLAEKLTELKQVKLQITEFNPDRLKMTVAK